MCIRDRIERDLKLADETGAGYHVCHISCKESVEVIRDAKKSGVDVTCETAPHYLVFDTDYLNAFINRWPELGGRFKMNPPIKDCLLYTSTQVVSVCVFALGFIEII